MALHPAWAFHAYDEGWVPRHVQPWLYVLTALCFQFSGGIYLGALDGIRGTTNFMIEDILSYFMPPSRVWLSIFRCSSA